MVLEIAYRYKGLDYLAADKHGNLYLLPHFDNRRTVLLKRINVFENKTKTGVYKSIKYKRTNYSFVSLRKRKIQVNETLEYFVLRWCYKTHKNTCVIKTEQLYLLKIKHEQNDLLN